MLEIENPMVVVVPIFLKHNGLSERLADSSCFVLNKYIHRGPIQCKSIHCKS